MAALVASTNEQEISNERQVLLEFSQNETFSIQNYRKVHLKTFTDAASDFESNLVSGLWSTELPSRLCGHQACHWAQHRTHISINTHGCSTPTCSPAASEMQRQSAFQKNSLPKIIDIFTLSPGSPHLKDLRIPHFPYLQSSATKR